jgi:type I restriction enzyme S subunit
MFGDPAANPQRWPVMPLSATAEIISGVAKGRKLGPDESVDLPYLRVANVKDGHLDLGEVKTIAIKHNEVDRLRIQPGDLLMTEGGDPDKLGRAALWNGEIELCVHQNHLFKVRSDRSRLDPVYLRSLVGSAFGKSYFLRVAKKTTGIASINKTQLSAFPVLLPPRDKQDAFARHVQAVESIHSQQAAGMATAQATFDALLAQLFRSGQQFQ